MLGDIHGIAGYLVAKFLLETDFGIHHQRKKLSKTTLFASFLRLFASSRVKSTPGGSPSIPSPPTSVLLHAISTPSPRIPSTSFFGRIFASFLGLPFESKFAILGAILGNLPDIDVALGPIFGGHEAFHRTFTHSFAGNAFIIPMVAKLVQKLLTKGQPAASSPKQIVSYYKCLKLVCFCVFSHLITDWITNYGTCLMWPFNNTPYTLGVITVLDFTTILFFYIWFTISRRNLFSQRKIMLYGFACFLSLMMYKRALLQEAHHESNPVALAETISTTLHVPLHAEDSKHHGHNLDEHNVLTTWLHPSNLDNSFHILTMDTTEGSEKRIMHVGQSTVSHFQAIKRFISSGFRDTIGFILSPPREFFRQIIIQKHPVLWTLIKESLPSVFFVLLYHVLYAKLFNKTQLKSMTVKQLGISNKKAM